MSFNVIRRPRQAAESAPAKPRWVPQKTARPARPILHLKPIAAD